MYNLLLITVVEDKGIGQWWNQFLKRLLTDLSKARTTHIRVHLDRGKHISSLLRELDIGGISETLQHLPHGSSEETLKFHG